MVSRPIQLSNGHVIQLSNGNVLSLTFSDGGENSLWSGLWSGSLWQPLW